MSAIMQSAGATEAVRRALVEVQARKKGTEHFKTQAEADTFAAAVLDKFNPWGYGSYVDVAQRGEIWVAEWAVGSAD